MKRTTTLLFLCLCFYFGQNALGQNGCPNTNTLFPVQVQNLVLSSTLTVTCANGGQYSRWQVCAGATFSWTTCGSNAFDTELTLIDDATGIELDYNDDACANSQSTIFYTPTFTGIVRVLINEYPCASNTICTNVVGTRHSPCGSCPDDTLVGATYLVDSTCGRGNDCNYTSAPDLMYAVQIPCEGDWVFSSCFNPGWDPELHLGVTCCSEDSSFNQDQCNGDGPAIFHHLMPGFYYLTLEGYDSLDCGTFSLSITGDPVPSNDSCGGAILLALTVPDTGSTECSTPDLAITCSGQTNNSSNGVWYKIVGNGNRYTASLCTGSGFDTRIRVFGGTCGALTCSAGNDNFCNPYSQASWCTTIGVTYYLLVDGVGTANGSFTIVVNETVLPSAAFSGLSPTYCVSSPPSVLIPVSPGGVFSGPGMSGSTFTPSPLILGSNVIIYSILSNGCAITSQQITFVSSSANAAFTGLGSSYCVNSPSVTLTPTQSGGTFSGPGVSGTTFNPTLAGAGTHQIIHTINLGGGCNDADTLTTTVNALPNASFTGLSASYCTNSPIATMVPSVPGGTFSGTGVAGSTFDPSIAGIGTHTVTYTITANGCTNTSSFSTTVATLLNGTFTGLNPGYCTSDPIATMFPVVPGGTFSGPGVSGSTFNPATAGVGTHSVNYTVTSGGCTGTSSQSISVGTSPNASFTGLPATACSNDPTVTLTPTTSGGTFSGPGASGTTFTPSVAGAGTHTIVYSVSLGGCTSTSSGSITVTASPDASFSGLNSGYCNSAGPVTLTPVTPGGTFTGNGITGNSFSPSGAGNGQHIITYSVTANGCTASWNDTVNIGSPMSASFSGLDSSYCVSDSASTLTPVNPGGNFSGAPGGIFDPSVTGPGTFTVTYFLTVNGCTSTFTDTTTVIAAPAVSFVGLDTAYCSTANSVTLVPTPTGGTFIGAGMVGNSFSPSTAGVGTHTISYQFVSGGCTGTSSQVVSVTQGPNPTIFGLSASYCTYHNPATMTAGTPGGIFAGPGVTGNVFTPSQAGTGTHNVTYTITGTCNASSSVTVIVNASPSIQLGPDTSICQGDTLHLDAGNPGSGFSWATPLGTGSNQQMAAYFPGTYTVTVLGLNGCSAQDTLVLGFVAPSIPSFSINTAGSPLILFVDGTTGNPTAWSWTFGDGGTGSAQNPSHTYAANGTYIVKLVVTTQCGIDSFIDTLQITNVSLETTFGKDAINIYPNPNNGEFTVELNGNFENATISVSDLLGREVERENNIKTTGKYTQRFNLNHLSRGTYLVTIIEGERSIVRKVVVE